MGQSGKQREVASVFLEQFEVLCVFVVVSVRFWEQRRRIQTERITNQNHAFRLFRTFKPKRRIHHIQQRQR